jgi:hypothetical protein
MATLIEIAKAPQAGSEDPRDLRKKAARLIEESVLIRVQEGREVAIDSIGAESRKVLMKPIPGRRGFDRPGSQAKKTKLASFEAGGCIHRG